MNSVRRKPITFLIFLAVGIPCGLRAQENSINTTSGSVKLKPIEVNYTTLSGLCYSINDNFLAGNKDFEKIIFPVNDYEAIRLLKRSESSASTGQIFKIIGLLGVATGITGLLTSPVEQYAPFWITAIGGGISFDVGGLFQSEAQTAKFNAIQRYNRFARGEYQVLPQAPLDEKSLLKFDKSDNTSIPTNDVTLRKKVN